MTCALPAVWVLSDLDVWQCARLYCAEIGRINQQTAFMRHRPFSERMNKTSLSIMENIAEGFERESRREFAQFLRIARGSTGEARSQLYAALDRQLLTPNEFKKLFDLVSRIGQMLRRLRDSLRDPPTE